MTDRNDTSAGVMDAASRLFCILLGVSILGAMVYLANPWGIWG